MHAKILVIVAVAAALASSVVVVASARTNANGLPAYTNGWQKWPRINKKPFNSTGPLSSAHAGVKNVYSSKRKVGSKYPNDTVIVKTIVKRGTKYVGQFATMRKMNGRWQFVEYQRSSATARYSLLAQGSLCQSCHVMAKSNDLVFTKK